MFDFTQSNNKESLAEYLKRKLRTKVVDVAANYTGTAKGQKYIENKINDMVKSGKLLISKPTKGSWLYDIQNDLRTKDSVKRAFMTWLSRPGNVEKAIPLIPKYIGSKIGDSVDWAKDRISDITK